MDDTVSTQRDTPLGLDARYEAALLAPNDNPGKCHDLSVIGREFLDRSKESKNIEDINKAISSLMAAISAVPAGHADLPGCSNTLGLAYQARFEASGKAADLDQAIIALEGTARLIMQSNLRHGVHAQFEHVEHIAHLDQAILAQSKAIELAPDGHPAKASGLNNLSVMFRMRFKHLGDVSDLNEALSAQNKAVELIPDNHPDKAGYLSNLGISFWTRFKRFGDVLDLDKAISASVRAAELTPDSHVGKPGYLNNTGAFFEGRFERFGKVSDLDEAILVQSKAVELIPDGHPNKAGFLSNLGRSFETRFKRFGDILDLKKSISVHSNLIALTPDDHPNKARYLSNLGISYLTQFQHVGDVLDLANAISNMKKAVELTPDGHPSKAGLLTNLGATFRHQFERFGNILDLNNAISAQTKAVDLTADDHPDKASRWNNLGISLQTQFEQLGNISDLDQAISAKSKAVELTLDNHPDKAAYLNNLGISFRICFQRLGDISELEKAILAQTEATKLTPEDHPAKAYYLNNLGTSFRNRFHYHKDVSDIDNAISAQNMGVDLTPDSHPDKPGHLNGLAASFWCRFGPTGDTSYIDKAISYQRKAVELTLDDDPKKIGYLNNLGVFFQVRFESIKSTPDLESAILANSKAIDLAPSEYSDKARHLTNLGHAFYLQYNYHQRIEDLHNAVSCFSQAAQISTSPALARFDASQRWADCASMISSHLSLDAYSCSLGLIPQVAWLGLPMAGKHRELRAIGDHVCKAAAAAIMLHKYNTALEWLEQGRSIVWSQLLHLRSPLDELHDKDPILATQLTNVSMQLDHFNTREYSDRLTTELTIEDTSQQHHQLAQEWTRLVDLVRLIPGFEDFLQPKKLRQLKDAARAGPVVVVNIYKDQCDALVLKKDMDDVIHIPLLDISHSQVQIWHKSLVDLVSDHNIRTRSVRHMLRQAVQTSKDQTLQDILSGLWFKIVKPVLENLEFSVSQSHSPPRIWWCLTGPLAFLPIHAAGIYNRQETGYKITDFVASSYTPTLTALLPASAVTRDKFQLLTIIQPSTPGAGSLPNTEKELAYIQQHAGTLPMMTLEGASATREHVVEGMSNSSWVHLACHGIQNTTDPTNSALLLHDGQLKLSEVIKLRLPYAEFAFLSACQTATGDQKLSEESVHLAAGMLLAGYHGVIATMWSIMDKDAPIVTDKVYALLFKGQQPDSTQAAHALHHAMQYLRDQDVPLISWVPFIHVGM